jgi:hypothetical protein
LGAKILPGECVTVDTFHIHEADVVQPRELADLKVEANPCSQKIENYLPKHIVLHK